VPSGYSGCRTLAVASERVFGVENQTQLVMWNAWKLATIGIAVVITTALITGLVVANWSDNPVDIKAPPKSVPAASNSGSRYETGVRSNRAISKRPNATNILEKAVIGGALGAGVGAAGGAIAGGGSGAGKGAAIGGLVGATAGTFYGLHDK
jgi:hypothetical protein